MYLRYRGGGVGHTVPVDLADPVPAPEEVLEVPQDCEEEADMGLGYVNEMEEEDIAGEEQELGDEEEDNEDEPDDEDIDEEIDEEDEEGETGLDANIGELLNNSLGYGDL